MKIWCSLNRNPANRWCESCALWSSFPVAYVSKIFLGKLLENEHCIYSLTYGILLSEG
jgi:hypothetical protein